MKVVVYTLGCKVNDVESGSLIRGLETLGYAVSREMERADLYVINTCAVTAEAERKSRQTVGKAVKCNPQAKVIVCGCASQKSPEDFLEKRDTVYAVTGARRKNKVLEIVKKGLQKEGSGIYIEEETAYEEMPLPECLKTRNFVKIQDGCNRFCAYCVIPYLRGRSRSRLLQNAAQEILESTAQETVVTGIDISDYRDEKGNDLADLLWAVRDATTRIRLGSLEVSLITPRFLSVLSQVKHFAPHFHLSLEKCRMIYDTFPNAAITTDIIAGFPTETEEDFLESLRSIEEAGFAQIHAFPYSPREGTNAYKKYKELPFALKKARVERLIEKGEEERNKYKQRFVGSILEMVPEQYIDGYTEGYSENYLRVYVQGEMAKTPTQVFVEGLFKDGLLARVASRNDKEKIGE